MKIKALELYSDNLNKQIEFYEGLLSLPLIEKSKVKVSFKIGDSILTFIKTDKKAIYHYCFLIPSNQLSRAIDWLSKRLELIEVEGSTKVPQGKSWNADSTYFYDGNGNIVECIARYDLKNESEIPFTPASIIGINEIGFPSEDIEKTNQALKNIIGTEFWQGNFDRFGTNGTQNGLFLLVNPTIKKTWFPTDLPITKDPFNAIVNFNQKDYRMVYKEKGWEAKAIIA